MDPTQDKPIRLDARLAPRLARAFGLAEAPEEAAADPDAEEVAAAAGETDAEDPLAEAADVELEPALAVALLGDALEARVSDVHMEPAGPGTLMRFRVDGRLREAALLPAPLARRLVGQLRTLARLDPVTAFHPEDARFSLDVEGRSVDLRLSTVPCLGGQKLALRIFDSESAPAQLEDLGLVPEDAEALRRWLGTRTGLFIAAGPAGAGKTTTAHSLLRSREDDTHAVLTLEDPVEYRLERAAQIEIAPEHGLSYAEALRTALRLDPDYLLVGEIRDEASARTAVRAALSGHAVLSTLHAAHASAALMPFLVRGVDRPELASALAVVMAQRLVRRLCPACRESVPPEEAEARWLEAAGAEVPDAIWRPVGCDECLGGYRGRIGLFEVWALDDEDREVISEAADEHTIRERLQEAGIPSLLDDALAKADAGDTSVDELRRVPDLLQFAR